MGWMYEYLEVDLKGQVEEKLAQKHYRSTSVDYAIDDVTLKRVTHGKHGGGCPETGIFDGTITLTSSKQVLAIKYSIKRKMPDNGFDYCAYEEEYEVTLIF